jgi:hypothetical protein
MLILVSGIRYATPKFHGVFAPYRENQITVSPVVLHTTYASPVVAAAWPAFAVVAFAKIA